MDPLSQAMAPPPDETPEQRRSREYDEEQARYRSAQIDDEIKAEKNAMKKKKNPIKILVLGQSESGPFLLAEVKKRVVSYQLLPFTGKSTTIKSAVFLEIR
jgi:guanine nucleotide-binding protein alpha-1 subunit